MAGLHTDLILMAGLSVARALCARVRRRTETEGAGFEAIDRAVLEIEKQARGLDEIQRSAQTIKSGSEKILSRAGIMKTALAEQLEVLGERVHALKASLEGAIKD